MSTEDPTTTPAGPVPPPPPPPPGPQPVEPFAVPSGSLYPAPLVYTPPPPYVPPPAYTPPPFAAAPAYGTASTSDDGRETDASQTGVTEPRATTDARAAHDARPTAGGGPTTDAGPTTADPTARTGPAHDATSDPASGPARNPAAPVALLLSAAAFGAAWSPSSAVAGVLLAAVAFVLAVVAGTRALQRGGRGAAGAAAAAFFSVVAVIVALTTAISSVVDADGSSPAPEGADVSRGDVADDEPTGEDATRDGADADAEGDGAGEDGTGDGAAAGGASVAGAQPLVVLDVAHGPHPEEPTDWWYVVVLENPNPDHVFEFAEMSVEALAADGTLIVARPEFVTALPGKVAVSGTFYELGGMTPDRVDVRLPVVQDVVHAPDGGGLAVGDLTVTASEWATTVEGVVTSTLAEDLDMARVVVVATGPDGQVVGAARGYVDRLPAGGEATFEADFYGAELPDGTRYTPYASP